TGGWVIPYFLVTSFAPILGACLGAAGYRALIARHLQSAVPVENEKDAPVVRGIVQASSLIPLNLNLTQLYPTQQCKA
ncbi:hypothetical protein RA265_30505, partial [Pseudomonas syringae pv. tagetis]